MSASLLRALVIAAGEITAAVTAMEVCGRTGVRGGARWVIVLAVFFGVGLPLRDDPRPRPEDL